MAAYRGSVALRTQWLRVSCDRFAATATLHCKEAMTALLQAAFVLPLHEQGIKVCCTVVRNKFWRFGLIAAVSQRTEQKRRGDATGLESPGLIAVG